MNQRNDIITERILLFLKRLLNSEMYVVICVLAPSLHNILSIFTHRSLAVHAIRFVRDKVIFNWSLKILPKLD